MQIFGILYAFNILDYLCCIVLIESIYMYPNLFQHVIYVKAKYVFYVQRRFYKTKHVLYYDNVHHVHRVFVSVFYTFCEYAILYKMQNFF